MDLIDNRFELEQCVASGGMGTVYRALDTATGITVAIKLLHAEGGDVLRRFFREARILAELRHPGIVRHVAHGTTADGTSYLAMEWLDGETLESRLERGPIPSKEALELGARLSDALSAAHTRGIVHRDLKPANILLQDGRTDKPRLLDFGVARLLVDAAEMTQAGVVVGTPAYMAPEQIRAWSVDQRVDLFALGCVLFECLTGNPPWVGTGPVAIMAKILFEEPPKLTSLMPELPDAVNTLILRLLEKDRDQRPTDTAAIAAELRKIWQDRASRTSTPGRREPAANSLTNLENRLVCVALCEGSASMDFQDTLQATQPDMKADVTKLVRIADMYSARIEVLLDGSIAAVITGAGEATDLVARAARTALALRAQLPEARMSLATGRGIVTEALPTGEAIESAAILLGQEGQAQGGIRIDDATNELLDRRFVTDRDGISAVLLDEQAVITDEARLLLGRPTPFVGREQEMLALEADFSSCIRNASARAMLVLGQAGSGKSRIRHELMSRVAGHAEVWVARGDPIRQGSSLAMLGQAIRHAASVREGEDPEGARAKIVARASQTREGPEAMRVAEFLGEICGVHFPDERSLQLKAARQNALLMADQMRRAFEDFLLSETRAHPVTLVLEDLQWGDVPTVQFVDAALRTAHARPFYVFALGRPDVDKAFPDLWAERQTSRISLGPLSKKACEELIRAVLGDEQKEKVARIIELAAGNAFSLEELIRSAAEGKSNELPRSVLAIAQARLEALPEGMRRILRAASVFGETFWPGGIATLLGQEPSSATTMIADLVERELAVRQHDSRFSRQGEEELMFRHSLLREAAYAMLTDEDRGLGHRLAAKWLTEAGERDAVSLAQHYDRGGDAAGAAREYARAAEQALEANDLTAVLNRAERAANCGARGEALAYLRLLQATAYHWRAEYSKAERAGLDALVGLRPLTTAWYRAAEEIAEAVLPLGQIVPLTALGDALHPPTGHSSALEAFVAAAATVSMQLLLAGEYDTAQALMRRMETCVAEVQRPSPLIQARTHFARATRAMIAGDVGTMLEHARAAVQSFDAAGDHRQAALMRTNLAYVYLEIGAYHEAEMTLRTALADAERIGLPAVVAAAKQNLGWALARGGKLAEARDETSATIAICIANDHQRMVGNSLIYMAQILLSCGDFEGAEREARRALDALAKMPPLRTYAMAMLASVLLAQDRIDEARIAVEEAMAALHDLGSIEEGEAFVRLTIAKVLRARGDVEGARAALAEAYRMLQSRAARISNPDWSRSFLENVPENAETIALARELNVLPTVMDYTT